MADLSIHTATAQIERALRDAIVLALGRRLPPVADVAALRATATGGALNDNDLLFVVAASVCYRWNTASTASDNGSSVIAPADAGATGRWLATTSTTETGYLRAVEFFDGSFSEALVDARLHGLRPCVVIHWYGAENTVASVVAGALYKHRPRFGLWCLSQNLRPEFEGQIGAELTAEATSDPGAQRIVGDLKALLAGNDLGQAGIDYCEIGNEQVMATSLQERRFAVELELHVWATTDNPEDDDQPVEGLLVHRELGDKGENATIDRSNYRVTGVAVPIGASLQQSISAGSAFIAGVEVTYAGESKVFAPNTDTYRDLSPDGTLTFTEVPHGADEPPVISNALRIGVTSTDDATVTADVILASTLEPFGDPAGDRVPQH